MGTCHGSHRKLITSIYTTPQKKIQTLVLSLLLLSGCFIGYFDFLMYLDSMFSARSLSKTTHCEAVCCVSFGLFLQCLLTGFTQHNQCLKRLHQILKLLCCRQPLCRNSRSYIDTVLLSTLPFCPQEIVLSSPHSSQGNHLYGDKCSGAQLCYQAWSLRTKGGRCWAGYLFCWADMLSRLKCTFNSPICQDGVSTSVSSADDIIMTWCCTEFVLIPHGCFKIDWCWGLSFAEVSVG